MDPSLEYACKRILELEQLLLVDVPETVWPAEVAMVLSQVESAGILGRTTSNDCSTISTECGSKNAGTVNYRRGPFAGLRHGEIRVRERNHR